MEKHLCFVVDGEKNIAMGKTPESWYWRRMAARETQPEVKSTIGKCGNRFLSLMMTKITWKMLKRGSSYECVDTLNSNWSHQVYGNPEVVFWKGNTQWFTRRHDTVWKRPKHQVGESKNTADQRGLHSEWRNPREKPLESTLPGSEFI